jgi:hypothetical protein
MPGKSINPTSDTIVVPDAQAGRPGPIDEHDPLTTLRPDIGIQIRDVRPGKPPCFDDADRAKFQADLTMAIMSEFPGAHIDSACVGSGSPAGQATAFGVWLAPPVDDAQRDRMHRGLIELGGRTPAQTISFFLNARLFAHLAAKGWNDPGMRKRLDGNGVAQTDGPVHLTDLKVTMRPPDTVVTTITGFDERWVPDANFAVTIAETYRTDGGGNLVHTAEQKLDVDTTVSTVLAAVFALTVFASGWFALPFALAAFQTVFLHGAEEQGLPAQKGVGSTVTDHLLLPAIPIPNGKKRPITYVGQVVVAAYGMFVGGRIETEVPRTPSIELKGPSSIQSAMGQGVVRGHYHVEVAKDKVGDLLGPVVYTWTSDGEVHGSGAGVTVLFDTPASGKTHLRHVSVTVTDADGIQVGDAREVRISTVSHQGPGGGHGGQGGGSGSNNPPSEP